MEPCKKYGRLHFLKTGTANYIKQEAGHSANDMFCSPQSQSVHPLEIKHIRYAILEFFLKLLPKETIIEEYMFLPNHLVLRRIFDHIAIRHQQHPRDTSKKYVVEKSGEKLFVFYIESFRDPYYVQQRPSWSTCILLDSRNPVEIRKKRIIMKWAKTIVIPLKHHGLYTYPFVYFKRSPSCTAGANSSLEDHVNLNVCQFININFDLRQRPRDTLRELCLYSPSPSSVVLNSKHMLRLTNLQLINVMLAEGLTLSRSLRLIALEFKLPKPDFHRYINTKHLSESNVSSLTLINRSVYRWAFPKTYPTIPSILSLHIISTGAIMVGDLDFLPSLKSLSTYGAFGMLLMSERCKTLESLSIHTAHAKHLLVLAFPRLPCLRTVELHGFKVTWLTIQTLINNYRLIYSLTVTRANLSHSTLSLPLSSLKILCLQRSNIESLVLEIPGLEKLDLRYNRVKLVKIMPICTEIRWLYLKFQHQVQKTKIQATRDVLQQLELV